MTPRPAEASALPAPAAESRPERARIGSARETRGQLSEQRGRPLLVSLYAELVSDGGLLGPPARRRLRRLLLRGLPGAVAAAGAGLVACGFYRTTPPGPAWIATSAPLLGTTVAVGWRRLARARAGRASSTRQELELGALALVAAFTASELSRALPVPGDAPLHALVYLAVAALVSLLPRTPGVALAAATVLFEAALWWLRGADPRQAAGPAVHAALVLGFAGLYHGILGARIAAGRRAERAALERRRRELDERARQLRLLAASGEVVEGEATDRLAEAAVLETDAAARGLLEVAEAAFHARTAAVWLLSEDDRELRLWECRSASDCVAERLPAGEGPPGVVVKRCAALRLHGDVRSANHYLDGARPKALLAVPLRARVGGHLRGVVLVDRDEETPFGPEDEQLLAKIATELARAAAAERLLRDGRLMRAEQERFYQAMERLNKTAKPRDVFDAVLAVAAGMVPVDFAALTLAEGEGREARHRVVRAVLAGGGADAGPGGLRTAGELEGKEFPDNGGLVACAVRLGSSLPAKALDPREAVVFDDATCVKGLASLKVLPLRAGEAVLGTLVVGATAPEAYGREAVRQLEAVALQAGDSILRARLFEATERLATTDGLTGLVNHRSFQARLADHLAAAQRYGKQVSLLLTDIDHFKAVNDTYGHPVGDVVLQQVARILQREARTTDVAARYGGEEFALVMPETDLEGALRTAERIRDKVGRALFRTEQGELRVTLSIGVATFPGDATTHAQLVERADGGLYHAKRHGRNRTVALGTPGRR